MQTDLQISGTFKFLMEIVYTYITKILHLTLTTLLHYLVKLENYNCYRFQWRVACETSEFILQDMKPP